MCGICGRLNLDPARPVDEALLTRMRETLSHRGPDSGGNYVSGPVGLGHRRLSIIDLSTGDQPMCNEDGTVWVAFNGEIYNYVELRRDHLQGHRFRSNSDTEVILHLYEEEGEEFVKRLRGMFAIALWDSAKRKLLLIRDRLGIKPLFYCVLPGECLLFGSEIKAILEDPAVPRRVNLRALDEYLSYLYVPAPRTMFEGIEKLPPGHYLVCRDGRTEVRQYWDVPLPREFAPVSEEQALERLESVLEEAVRLRLRSDVPLGAFLSGGIDSSTVTGVMAGLLKKAVRTVSVGFSEDGYNELPDARRVAQAFGCEHHETVVRPDIEHLVPWLVWLFDEPFADSSAVPTYYLSEVTRRHVTVALSGDGGDELFAGYAWHRVEQWEARARKLLSLMGGGNLRRIAGALPAGLKGRQSLINVSYPPSEAYARKRAHGLFKAEEKRHLYSSWLAGESAGFDSGYSFKEYFDRAAHLDPLSRALYVDIKTYLVDDILVKVDRMSMAHALEVRVPLLDHVFVETVAQLPPEFKLRGRDGKYILRKLMARRLPPETTAKRKQGFKMPLPEWLRGELRPMVEEALFDGRLASRGYFDMDYVRGLWQRHLAGGQYRDEHLETHRLWMLVLLELWHRVCLERTMAVGPPA